jgi:hypothetical protein
VDAQRFGQGQRPPEGVDEQRFAEALPLGGLIDGQAGEDDRRYRMPR